jgi:Tfp pilus assembly protein PilZ
MCVKNSDLISISSKLEDAIGLIEGFDEFLENSEDFPPTQKWFMVQQQVFVIESYLSDIKFTLDRVAQVKAFYEKVVESYNEKVSAKLNAPQNGQNNKNEDEVDGVNEIEEDSEYEVYTETE